MGKKPTCFDIYPNPALHEIFIRISFSEARISLVSMEGRTVILKDAYAGLNSLDLAGIPEGIYYLGIRSTEESIRRKVVILK